MSRETFIRCDGCGKPIPEGQIHLSLSVSHVVRHTGSAWDGGECDVHGLACLVLALQKMPRGLRQMLGGEA